jgi:hypothetical protein
MMSMFHFGRVTKVLVTGILLLGCVNNPVTTVTNQGAMASTVTPGQLDEPISSILLQEQVMILEAELAVDDNAVWVLLYEQDELLRIDSATNTIAQRIDLSAVGVDARELAAGEGMVWVSGSGTLETGGARLANAMRIDPDSGEIIAEAAFPTKSLTIGEGAVWAVGDGQLYKLDAATNSVIEQVRVRLRMGLTVDVQITIAEGVVWLLGEDEQTERTVLLKINPLTLEELERIQVEQVDQPYIRLADGEGSLWLGGYSDMCSPECSTLIARFNTTTSTITPLVLTDTITRSNYVWQMAEENGNLWMCVGFSLLRLDITSGEVLSTLPSNCANQQQSIAFGGNSLWTLNLKSTENTLYLDRYDLAQFE